MPLLQGEIIGYDFNRMVVEFTMLNQGKVVSCAISTAALDNIERNTSVKADGRVDQFIRLRAIVEGRAEHKHSAGFVEFGGRVVLRSEDFSTRL
jgi:hypothetical protein